MKKLQTGTRLVIGKNSVREVLRWSPDRVVSILSVKEPSLVLGLENAADFDWLKINAEEISELSGSESHQGIALIVREKPKLELKEVLKTLQAQDKATIVILSSVQDPHHLGAIFRAAEVFAADIIIWSKQHSPGITAAVTKVAVGATELVSFCEVANINDAIRKCKAAGFWTIAAEPDNSQGQTLTKFSFPSHSALILGAEGEGIPRLTLELSDFKVAIEQYGKIDSISLSQAAAIFLYEIKRQSQ